MTAEKLEIKDVTIDNVDQLIDLCIPPQERSDRFFVEGKRVKKKWATKALESSNIAKIAYLNSKPVGLIQYRLDPEEKIVDISCIFVPDQANSKRGIGKSLLKALLEDMKIPKPAFNHQVPLALVTHAFEVPPWYPQYEFYRKMGFKKAKGDDPFLYYFPLKEGYVYQPREEKYVPQKEDRKKALIFYDPSCPFCIRFSEKCKELVLEVAPAYATRMVNQFEEQEEVRKRGRVPFCAVNGKAIATFFLDTENFKKEAEAAMNLE